MEEPHPSPSAPPTPPDSTPFNFNLDLPIYILLQHIGVFNSTPTPSTSTSTAVSPDYSVNSTAEWLSLLPTADLAILLSTIPSALLPATFTPSSAKPSRSALLETLARLALEPCLTMEIMHRFRPIVVVIWGKWLGMLGFSEEGEWRDGGDGMEVEREMEAVEKVFRAMVKVLGVWRNVLPFLSTLLRHPLLLSTPPLPSPASSASALSIPLLTLHSLLTSLPQHPQSLWTFPATIEEVLKTHPHRGTRLLAWRILRKWYGLYSNLGEDLRETWVWKDNSSRGGSLAPLPSYLAEYKVEYEKEFGVFEGEDEREDLVEGWVEECAGEAREVEGGIMVLVRKQSVDGWILPSVDSARIRIDARRVWENEVIDKELLGEEVWNEFEKGLGVKSYGSLKEDEVGSSVVNIEGRLLFREGFIPSSSSSTSPSTSSSTSSTKPEPFIPTPSTTSLLRSLSLHLQLRLPVLITSPPSSGKSTTLNHLWSLLHSSPSSSTPTAEARKRGIVFINLADRSLDSKSLLGSLSSSPSSSAESVAGTFTFIEGPLTRAVRQGRWIVLTSIDQASVEILSVVKVLAERMKVCSEAGWGEGGGEEEGGVGVRISGGQGKWVKAGKGFMLFATSSSASKASLDFFGAHFLSEVRLDAPTLDEVGDIVEGRFGRLGKAGLAKGMIEVWEKVRLGSGKGREVGVRDLIRWCRRVESLLPADITITSISTNPVLQEEIFVEARDVFLGSLPVPPPSTSSTSSSSRYSSIAKILGEGLGLSEERIEWVLRRRVPELVLPKLDEDNGIEKSKSEKVLKIGRVSLPYHTSLRTSSANTRPYALTKPSLIILEKLAVSLRLSEPVLMVGETGTGKTAAVGYLANLVGKNLVALNLSNQTEAGDLVGGFRPVDEAEESKRVASQLVNRFVELFSRTFSINRNAEFVSHVKKAFEKKRWGRLVSLWREAFRMACERLDVLPAAVPSDNEEPRKRRKLAEEEEDLKASWRNFVGQVGDFDINHCSKSSKSKSKFVFNFVEGPLSKAIRNGDWVLLDEVNLASSETLESLSTLLQTSSSSLILTEQGDLEPIPRHPEFRLFACMNPATDVGKRDLPTALRSKFNEIWVPPPDEDKEALVTIVNGYIGRSAVQDRSVILDVAELYGEIKELQKESKLADGSNQPPHFSMRTLARALTFGKEFASVFGLRRALFEGFLMAFTMLLDVKSTVLVRALLDQHIVSKAKNRGSLFAQIPTKPTGAASIRFGPYWLETGKEEVQEPKDYILTPSVQAKVLDLARAILTRKVPVLIQGPTSAGKTSVVEYLAKRTGHRFVRINNHEHTDIQEYIGTYLSDPTSGKLVFQEGVLVRALRRGDWIVLDELNLAPTDVLEALNRLLDDNRELVIPETGEVVKPHPHFMLFATQNPPGLYGGRKVLSRAFRNRFLEMHFGDVPQSELETILCQRCKIAPSYAKKTVAVFVELQRRRQAGRVFEQKQAFATLRDLFRWGGRGSVGYQQLAEDGYMLLAERARRADDKQVVKEVIEQEMKVTIDARSLYDFDRLAAAGLPEPPSDAQLVWTSAMRRLYYLIAAALLRNEPVLLVGETGSGKTSVCQSLAVACDHQLHVIGCHQNTETADLLGGQRPLRNRSSIQAVLQQEALSLLPSPPSSTEFEATLASTENFLTTCTGDLQTSVADLVDRMRKATSLFEWHDGPLVQAMQAGDYILLDEISLADDSVLERLNSVLEPSRTLVLAEKGGRDLDDIQIIAQDTFQILATMNPGGDFGKKELSPALRNRFTEIWVPHVDHREDLLLIIESRWRDSSLELFGPKILDFGEWFGETVGTSGGPGVGLRDILAWVDFLNVATLPSSSPSTPSLSPNEAFCHGAMMTIVDGLGALPSTSGLTKDALARLRADCYEQLESLVSVHSPPQHTPLDVAEINQLFFVGPFSVAKGKHDITSTNDYALQAPTTRLNAMRLIRALQLSKPVLLEGSPGVGKTSLVTALAAATGHNLVRINLSDQTDLMDLLGSDLPVEGGRSGEFAWKDAPFLAAMQQGSWVLLDEMNLASQSVLEGLNSSLDHRGTVYIPELDRTFARHPDFRIFAAQNPLGQGGGRKGLPRSFLDRFSIVHMEELNSIDLNAIAHTLYPDIDTLIIQKMIAFNTAVHHQTMQTRAFGMEGSPWEFNLRDVLRWLSLLQSSSGLDIQRNSAVEYVGLLYLQRFRSLPDRIHVARLFASFFGDSLDPSSRPWPSLTARFVQFGHSLSSRSDATLRATTAGHLPILQRSLQPLESLSKCIEMGWLAILTGSRGSGKTTLVRQLASLTGHVLHEFSMNAEVDTLELLGSFEQAERYRELGRIATETLTLLRRSLPLYLASPTAPSLHAVLTELDSVLASFNLALPGMDLSQASKAILRGLELVTAVELSDEATLLREQFVVASSTSPTSARFEWIDGPLVQSMKRGDWLLLEDANLCSPSVLDRLNSLFEPGGRLQLAERGPVDGEIQIVVPHPDFRLVMTLDPRYGELSRAMRNRGIEIAVLPSAVDATFEDTRRLDKFRQVIPTESPTLARSSESLLLSAAALTSSHGVPTRQNYSVVEVNDWYKETSLAGVESLLSIASPSRDLDSRVLPHLIACATSPLQHGLVLRLSRTLAHFDRHGLDFTLRSLEHHPLSLKIESTKNLVANLRGVPSIVLVHQPLDLTLCPHLVLSSADNEASSQYLSKQLDTLASSLVGSSRRPEVTRMVAAKSLKSLSIWDKSLLSAARKLQLDDADPAMIAIAPLVLALDDLVTRLAGEFSDGLTREEQEMLVSSAKSFRSLGFELRHVSASDILDFSSIQHVAAWVAEALDQLPLSLAAVASDAKLQLAPLLTSLVLTTGMEMPSIWKAFLPFRPVNTQVNDLYQRLLVRGKGRGTYELWDPALVALYLDVTTTLGVPSSTSFIEKDSLDVLEQLILSLPALSPIPSTGDLPPEVTSSSDLASLIVVELSAVAGVLQSKHAAEQAISVLSQVVQKSGNVFPLTSVLAIRQMQAWPESESLGINDRASTEFAILSGWTERLALGLGPTTSSHPSSDLARPALLRAAVQLCTTDSSTLGNLTSLSHSLARSAILQTLAASEPSSRLQTLRDVLIRTISLTAATVDEPTSSTTSISDLLLRTDRKLSPAVAEAADLCLAHVLPTLDSKNFDLSTIGEGFVGFARFFWLLYVPNRPLDPAVGHRARTSYLERQILELSHFLEVLKAEESLVSGNGSNSRITETRRELDNIRRESDAAGGTLVSRPANPIALSSFFLELHSFRQQVASDLQLDNLLEAIRSGWTAETAAREATLQHSLETLLRRLELAYAELPDILAPVQMALCSLKIGFSFLAQAARSALLDSESMAYSQLLSRLVSFPSIAWREDIATSDLPLSINPGETVLPPAHATLLQIAALVSQQSGKADLPELVRITKLYDRMYYLWTTDRRRAEEEAKEAESLYRSKADVQQIASDEELEAAEFAALFPAFEEDEPNDVSRPSDPTSHSTSKSTHHLIQPNDQSTLASLHTRMFAPREESGPTFDRFESLRSTGISKLLPTLFERLDMEIDVDSAPYRVNSLVDISQSFEPHTCSARERDFYTEPDVRETAKAVPILEALSLRLLGLIELWPDQIVLQNLRDRCERILSMSSKSPIAQVLGAIEQLLTHTEDWESYASREHSLVFDRSAITNLIVEWRRLELTCWSRLLSTVQSHFGDPVAEWWFRFYEVVIRGAPGMESDEDDDAPKKPDDYYRDLVSLLDSFLSTSSAGQFTARLQLVFSFGQYAAELGTVGSEIRGAESLRRVSQILFNIHGFYDNFTANVTAYLKAERSRIEKDVQNLIKLASWKDVNVYALRQSAIRSHHQLYKSVRKLRAILQKPASDFFVPGDSVVPFAITPVLERASVPDALPSIPAGLSIASGASHLVRTEQTLHRFAALASTTVTAYLEAKQATPLDEFVMQIITTSKALRDEPLGAKEGREQRVKSLVTRKRRAWIELLRELKRVGLSPTPVPAVVARLSDAGFVYSLQTSRELLLMSEQHLDSSRRDQILRSDSYHYRLLSQLPTIHSAPSTHHTDISTREVQRIVGSIESLVSISFDNRGQLLSAVAAHATLEFLIRRMELVASDNVIQPSLSFSVLAKTLRHITSQILLALKEAEGTLAKHDMAVGAASESTSLRAALQEAGVLLSSDGRELANILDDTTLPEPVLSTPTEVHAFEAAYANINSTVVGLSTFISPPSLRYIHEPLVKWFVGLKAPSVHPSPSVPPPGQLDALNSMHQRLINSVLVVAQDLAKLAPPKAHEEDEDLGDLAIKTASQSFREILSALRLPEVLDHTMEWVQACHVAATSSENLTVVNALLLRVSPFLHHYVMLVNHHLSTFLDWHNASLKLAYVLTSVVKELSAEGFCQPSDDDGAGTEDDANGQTSEGTGMADGKGAKNVSKDIEDESQVEGLQADVEQEKGEKQDEEDEEGKDDAVEMSMDFDGEMEDRGDGDKDEKEDSEESDDDNESQPDPEEQVADVDPLDPSSVDEKFWGEESSKDTSKEEVNQETSKSAGEAEMTSKDEDASAPPPPKPEPASGASEEEIKDDAPPPGEDADGTNEGENQDEETGGDDEEEGEDSGPQADDGERLDERMPEADNLDLPEDLQLDGDDKKDEPDLGSELGSMDGMDDLEDETGDDQVKDTDADDVNQEPAEEEDVTMLPPEDGAPEEVNLDEDNTPSLDPTLGGVDKGAGGGGEPQEGAGKEDVSAKDSENSADRPEDVPAPGEADDSDKPEERTDENGAGDMDDDTATAPSNAANGRSQQRSAATDPKPDPSSESKKKPSPPQERSLGEALKSWRRRFEAINDLKDPDTTADGGTDAAEDEVEFVPEGHERESDGQALGSAREDQVQQLEKLQLDDSEEPQTAFEPDEMNVDGLAPLAVPSATVLQVGGTSLQGSDAKAVNAADLQPDEPLSTSEPDPDDTGDDDEAMDDSSALAPPHVDDAEVEQAMLEWRSGDDSALSADGVWRLYESLTRDLSYALTEQLRLILEPTLATRLKGDYRSGKRLNMKKIIPYIASEFTKDKIWLRRTRPSQREYQILIAIDDSKSMADSHSVHLAYQSLALISRALTRLEVGGISICRFGETMDVLHQFDAGPVSEEAGATLLGKFTFAQRTTDVRLLVEKSLAHLAAAKESASASKSSLAAGELWQLQIIISDGVCQDHEKLRALLRRAAEQKVMFVFIVIDSLHRRTEAGATLSLTPTPESNHNSILAMKSVSYSKGANGQLELKMDRYLDTFPFEYFVVLRDAEALPEVLSATLRQFFERVSSDR